MRLMISRSRNKTFYYVIESERNGDKVTSHTVCKLGEHSELLRQGIEDPRAYCQDRVKEINDGLRENTVTITDTYDCRQIAEEPEGITAKPTYRNVGYRYLKCIMDQLKLKEFSQSIKGRAQYDPYRICVNLVIDRILDPRSKRAAWLNRDIYAEDFDHSLQDSYRFLELLDANSDRLKEHLYEHTKSITGMDTSVLYYDCTNFYCEAEEEDGDLLDEDGDIIQYGMRKYGASKEHRPNPIVQMGLFTDRNGIPLTYCIEHGSNNEQNTILPLEQHMVNTFGTSKFIYCSDAGLGSLKCRIFNALPGRSYVVTQSLKKIEKKELSMIFKDTNWQVIGKSGNDPMKDKPIKIEAFRKAWQKKIEGKEELTPEEKALAEHDMVYKKFPLIRKADKATLREIGLKVESGMKFTETLFITFSMKYFLYQQKILDRQIERAQKKIDREDAESHSPNDVNRLISKDATTKNGEVCEETVLSLNTEQIAQEKKFHGFYAIATNRDKSSIEEVLEITSQRWRIEQSFRIMKSEFDSRPYFVWTPESIRGHFAVCYIALLVYRLLERQLLLLDPSKNTFSATQVLTTLRNMNVDRMGNGKIYKALYTPSVIVRELEKIYSLKLNAGYFRAETIEGKKGRGK